MPTRRAVLGGTLGTAAAGAWAPAGAADAWPAGEADAIVRRVRPPRIPARDVVVRRTGGGDDSAAIAAAIDRCRRAGGGRVVLPAGLWRSGPIRLGSRMALHVAAGATLRFIPEPDRYLPPVPTRWEGVELMGYHPLIYAIDEHDVAVTGAGTIDGGADDAHWWFWKGPWGGRFDDVPDRDRQAADRARLFAQAERGVPVRDRVFGAGSRLRPPLFQAYRCRDVMVSGVTIVNAPFWLLHPVDCDRVLIRGVTCSSHGPNNDGIDPESCRDVVIEDCTFDTGDDCIALKSGRNADGRRLAKPCENIVIRRCRMKDGHAGLAVGSELSGGIRRVFLSDCTMDSPHLMRVLIVKTNGYRGGVVEDVHLHRLRVGRVELAVAQLWMVYEEGMGGDFVPVIRRVTLSDVAVAETARLLVVHGRADSPVTGLVLDGVTVRRERQPSVVTHAANVRLTGVTVNGRAFAAADLARLPGVDTVRCDKWATCR